MKTWFKVASEAVAFWLAKYHVESALKGSMHTKVYCYKLTRSQKHLGYVVLLPIRYQLVITPSNNLGVYTEAPAKSSDLMPACVADPCRVPNPGEVRQVRHRVSNTYRASN
jgi:hypothetical protein